MRSSVLCLCGALLILLGLVPAGEARTLVLKEKASFREGPAKTSGLLSELPPGTSVEVLSESAGWLQVTTSDGKTGYIWGEHTADPGAEPAKTPAPPAGAEGAAPADPRGVLTSLHEDLVKIRSEIAALREEAKPSNGRGDLDGLRVDLGKLAEAQRELNRRLDASGTAPVESATSAAAVGWLGVGLGLIVGWFAALIGARRRAHRSPNRLRL